MFENIGLVICTRSRLDNVRTLFKSLASADGLPANIVLVDSSPELTRGSYNFPPTVVFDYLRSEPGLPRQRNVGIAHLLTKLRESLDLIIFLDDDVAVPPQFFSVILDCMSRNPNAIGIGAYDKNLQSPSSKFRLGDLVLGVRSDNPYSVLKSGLTYSGSVVEHDVVVDWFPGHSMVFRRELFDLELFDATIRMFGEDVEFQSRARLHGDLLMSSELYVFHSSEPSGRVNDYKTALYSDGARWNLAVKKKYRVNKTSAIGATIMLAIHDLADFLRHGNRGKLFSFCGHVSFLFHLVSGRNTLDLVEYAPAKVGVRE